MFVVSILVWLWYSPTSNVPSFSPKQSREYKRKKDKIIYKWSGDVMKWNDCMVTVLQPNNKYDKSVCFKRNYSSEKTAAFIYELQSKWQQLLPYFHDIFCGLCTNAAHYQYFEEKKIFWKR